MFAGIENNNIRLVKLKKSIKNMLFNVTLVYVSTLE